MPTISPGRTENEIDATLSVRSDSTSRPPPSTLGAWARFGWDSSDRPTIGVVQPRAVNRTEVLWHVTSLAGAEPESLPLRLRIGEDIPNFGDPDDIENWERAQRGLELVPEVEWLHTGRGSDGEEGAHYGVTNEAPMRAYQREWLRLMQQQGGETP